jgi:hypothetical protein
MPSKPSVFGKGATGGNVGAGITYADPGARSGILAGVSFVAGVAAAMGLSDAPYPVRAPNRWTCNGTSGRTPAPPGSAQSGS